MEKKIENGIVTTTSEIAESFMPPEYWEALTREEKDQANKEIIERFNGILTSK